MNEDKTQAPPAGADVAAQPAADIKPNAELAALQREARAVDGQPQAAERKEQNAVALSMTAQNTGELHAALTMARDAALPLLAMVLSERKAVMLSAIWSDATMEAIAKNGAQVLALHGIALSNLTGGMGPYIGLALSLGPAVFATHRVMTTPDPKPAEVVQGAA